MRKKRKFFSLSSHTKYLGIVSAVTIASLLMFLSVAEKHGKKYKAAYTLCKPELSGH